MLANIAWALLVIIIFTFVAWRKYKEKQKTTKQWEGRNPNESPKSTEELRQNENKYRKGGGGTIGF